MPFGVDDALMITGALLGGIGAFGESPQEQATADALETLRESEDYFKETPFTKDEIMNVLLPQVQKLYRGAADIVAGKIGATVGEAGVAKGQSFIEYYTQALAPTIARGEEQAAGAVSDFGKWFSQMDAQAKNRFMQSVGMQLQGAQGLPSMNQFQRVVTGALSGLDLGATAGGNIATAQALRGQGDALGDIERQIAEAFGSGGSVEQISAGATGITDSSILDTPAIPVPR